MNIPSFVVSDIHLGAVPESTERAFRRFLEHVATRSADLVINGDLFDFWFEYRTVIQAQHYRTLAALRDLRESGVRIRFVGGNHDAWGNRFLSEEIGMEVLRDGTEIEIAGRTALLVHGDGLGEGDLGYRLLKRVLRSGVSERLFRALHPDLGSRIASGVSTTREKHGTPELAHPGRASALRDWASAELDRRPHLDLVLAGHTHTPALEEVRPQRFYVNTGDWINHFTYLELTPSAAPTLRRWPATD
jgi:UDP-2,3-diacylglucosamine hydrolase